jgi:hypothetical protein
MTSLQQQAIDVPAINHSLYMEQWDGKLNVKSVVNNSVLLSCVSRGRPFDYNSKIAWILRAINDNQEWSNCGTVGKGVKVKDIINVYTYTIITSQKHPTVDVEKQSLTFPDPTISYVAGCKKGVISCNDGSKKSVTIDCGIHLFDPKEWITQSNIKSAEKAGYISISNGIATLTESGYRRLSNDQNKNIRPWIENID